MQKREWITLVSQRCGLNKQTSERAMDAVFATLAETLARGGRAHVSGLGVFQMRIRAPRVARNPHTGQSIPVPPARVPVFRPSSAFLKQIRAGQYEEGT